MSKQIRMKVGLTGNYSPTATIVMFTQLLKHFNLNHCCIMILLHTANNFNSHHFFPFTIPAFEDLTKSTFTHLTVDLIYISRKSKDHKGDREQIREIHSTHATIKCVIFIFVLANHFWACNKIILKCTTNKSKEQEGKTDKMMILTILLVQ